VGSTDNLPPTRPANSVRKAIRKAADALFKEQGGGELASSRFGLPARLIRDISQVHHQCKKGNSNGPYGDLSLRRSIPLPPPDIIDKKVFFGIKPAKPAI
jgi:hypothetical protein